jgi:replicative DNA helicase
VDIIVRKNRHGRTGKVELEWVKYNGRFSAVDRSKELTTTSPL